MIAMRILGWLPCSVLLVAPFMLNYADGGVNPGAARHLWLAIPLCLLAIASPMLYLLAAMALLFALVVHQHVARHWGSGQFDSRFEAILESPPGEAPEYLQAHIDAADAAFIIGSALAVAGLFLAIRRLRPLRPPIRWAAAIALAALTALILAFQPAGVRSFPPAQMARGAWQASENYARLSSRSDYLLANPLERRDCAIVYDRIVVVIGESAFSGHMSIFGYAKPTTPFAVESRPQAFDALAPSNQTRYSLGMMFTDADVDSWERFYRAHSLVGELRACGYRTSWVSNQGRRGEHDSFATSIAREADEQHFLNEWSWKEVNLDGRIVELLRSRGIFEKTRQATFIHLIGSHVDYVERYPEGFGFPDAADIVSQYDNSILYTDQVLSELHRGFAGSSLLFVYVSDHGQKVSNESYGSGFLPGYQEEFRTPLLVWTDRDERARALRDRLGAARLNLESFDDVFRYLAGLTDTPRLSTRETVTVLKPGNRKQYPELESLAHNARR
jgi:glucan phosphoethanolaminetransferase (alkaline phosphatase superfamily)